jgi:hypothetical protein
MISKTHHPLQKPAPAPTRDHPDDWVHSWMDAHKDEIEARANEVKKSKMVWVVKDGHFVKVANPHLVRGHLAK